MKFLEENIGISFHDLGFGNGFLYMTPKAQETGIDKLDFISYIHTIEWYSAIKKWSIDTCYNVSEPWKYTKWKNPDTKGHILSDCIYIKYP